MLANDRTSAAADLQTASELASSLRANFDLTRISLYRAIVLFAQNNPQAADIWQQTVRLIQNHGYEFLVEQERELVLPFIAAGLDSPDTDLVKTSKDLSEQLLRVSPAALRVEMLGGFAVWVGARQVAKEALRQRRAGELLALLLCSTGHTLTYTQVTEAMCPEKDPDAALDFYHHAISSLRRLLEPDLPDRRFVCRYLKVDDERIKLILPKDSSTDLDRFENAVRAKDWAKAATLYTGDFLPALCDADWTLPLRQHLTDQIEYALVALANERLLADDPAACLDLCRRVLLKNAWQEQAVELGMQAATALGDRMTAIKLYQRLEKALEKELGIAPQKELQLLYLSVRRRSLK